MGWEDSSVSHLSVVMTTDQGETTQTSGAPAVTSTSRGAAVYFECAVLFIGVVGTIANGLVLYALVASKQHKKHVLIVNQNALDLYSCVLLIITYGMKLFNIRLVGLRGYWLCMLLFSENLLWCGVYGSFVNLTVIAFERYLKVAHSIWSKAHLRKWMTYLVMAFIWISSFVHQMAVAFVSSAVIDGACYGYRIWENPVSGVAYGIFYFFAAYVIVLAIFVFCYGKILIAIRRQAQVMSGHSATGTGSTTAQAQSHQIQSNIIKTMILVCAFYAIAWLPENINSMTHTFVAYLLAHRGVRASHKLPENIYFLLMSLNLNLSFLDSGYYSVLFIAFLYICANPFIYATKFDPVRRTLVRLIPCQKVSESAGGGSVETT